MKDILGIEIGNKTIKIAQLRRGVLRNFVAVNLPDNVVIDNELVAFDAMSDILKETIRANHFSTKNCALVLSESDVYLRRLTLPAMSEKQLMVNLPYEFKDYLSEDKDKYLYDYSMIRLIKGEEEKVTEMELLGAVVSKEKIEKYEQMFKRAGLKLVKAVPRETALSSLVQVLNKDSETTEFAILDLGYKTSKVDIFKEGVYEVTRTIEQGGETVERIVADVLDVDEHVASQYLEMNKDNIQENERCVDVYSSIATEIMRVMNYYAFENRDSNLETIYYCGGGSYIKRYVDEIASMVSLNLEPLSVFGPEEDKDAYTRGPAAIGACIE
ncbi:MAG: pilus assembly protein PilM [Erysipelotrichaceae bacterium]|nr:pilus assembly protein PilM [Erysipelotrichaceae bacterium]